MKIRFLLALLIALAAWLILGKSSCDNPPSTVAQVDLEKFMGKWYEIARYSNFFERNCIGAFATYTLQPDGEIKVSNQCYDKSCSGKLRVTEATAWSHNPNEPAKLKVQFFWPIKADYWIIDLDQENYSYAAVSDPCRKYLWILSRKPTMTPAVYYLVQEHLKAKGYDLSKLQLTPQCTVD